MLAVPVLGRVRLIESKIWIFRGLHPYSSAFHVHSNRRSLDHFPGKGRNYQPFFYTLSDLRISTGKSGKAAGISEKQTIKDSELKFLSTLDNNGI